MGFDSVPTFLLSLLALFRVRFFLLRLEEEDEFVMTSPSTAAAVLLVVSTPSGLPLEEVLLLPLIWPSVFPLPLCNPSAGDAFAPTAAVSVPTAATAVTARVMMVPLLLLLLLLLPLLLLLLLLLLPLLGDVLLSLISLISFTFCFCRTFRMPLG